MKPTRFTLLFVILTAMISPAQESIPLWPEGKTPYAKETDVETGRPKLFLYPVGDEEERNGAAVVVCPLSRILLFIMLCFEKFYLIV